MDRLQIVHLVVFFIAVFEPLVQASYYLDDTDSSITYVGYWMRVSSGVDFLDRTKLYNGTIIYAPLDEFYPHCTMAISFNGSGITLYSVMIIKLRFNVSIDGGPLTSYQNDGVLGCCNSTIQPLFNSTMYKATSLPLGYHTLLLTLFMDNATPSTIWFDYAFVDTSDNPKSTSDVHSSTIDSPAKSKPRSVIGPAIGGTVGGILAITIAILILFWKRRKTRRGGAVLPNPDANILVSDVDRRPIVGASYLPSSPTIYPDPSIEVDRVPIIGGTHHLSSNVSPSIPTTWPNIVEPPPQSRVTSSFLDPNLTHSSSTVPSTLPLPVSNPLPSENWNISEVNDANLTSPRPDLSPTSDSDLAAQEARFLRNLYDRNAPAEEIAELMQAMHIRARERGPTGVAVSSGDAPNAEHLDIAPPAYGSQISK